MRKLGNFNLGDWVFFKYFYYLVWNVIYFKILDYILKLLYMLLELIIELIIYLKYYFKGFLVKGGNGVINRCEILILY